MSLNHQAYETQNPVTLSYTDILLVRHKTGSYPLAIGYWPLARGARS